MNKTQPDPSIVDDPEAVPEPAGPEVPEEHSLLLGVLDLFAYHSKRTRAREFVVDESPAEALIHSIAVLLERAYPEQPRG